MTTRDTLVHSLDRPAGRGLLAAIATAQARRFNRSVAAPPLRVFYDRKVRAWGRAQGNRSVIDGASFKYWKDQLSLQPDGTPPWTATARKLWFVDYKPKAGDVILDIGAEVGTDTIAFAEAVGPTGRVIAVEAHPVTCRLLERTVELSGFQDRVTCLNAAIMSKPGTVVIEDDASTLRSTVKTEGSGHTVRGLSLDDLCEELGLKEIALLKMNIEGAERDALQGATKTLANTRHVVVAAHDFRADRGDGESYRTKDFVLSLLRGAGMTTRMAPYDANRDPVADRDHILAKH